MPTNHHTREGYEALYERLYFEKNKTKPSKALVKCMTDFYLLVQIDKILAHFDCVQMTEDELELDLVY